MHLYASKISLSDLSYMIELFSGVKINCIMVLLTSYFSDPFARDAFNFFITKLLLL